MRLLIRWIVLVISIVAAAHASQWLGLPFSAQTETAGDWFRLFVGAAILAFLNATLGNLLKLLTLPLTCLTLGLFSLVINAVMLELAGSLGLGFRVETFWAAFVGSIFISIVNGLLGGVLLADGGKAP